jgi:peptidoglycan-N-acetylglucosamine deacetylase
VVDACAARLGELFARLDDLGVDYRQDFPDSVVLTRAGRQVGMTGAYLGDG